MIQTASLEITPEMLVLDAGIDEFKGAWRALGTLAPERLAALRGSPPSITVTVYQIQQLRVAFNAHPHSVHLVNCHRNSKSDMRDVYFIIVSFVHNDRPKAARAPGDAAS